MFNWARNTYRKVIGKPTLEQEAGFRKESGYNGKIKKADSNYNLAVNLELQSRIYKKEAKYNEAKQFKKYLGEIPQKGINQLEANLNWDQDVKRTLKEKIETQYHEDSPKLKQRRYEIQKANANHPKEDANISAKKRYIKKTEKEIETIRERKNQINSFDDIRFKSILVEYVREEYRGKDAETMKKRCNQLFKKVKERCPKPNLTQIEIITNDIINKTNRRKEKRDSVIRHVNTSYYDLPESKKTQIGISLKEEENKRNDQPLTELQKRIDAYTEKCKEREMAFNNQENIKSLEEKLSREGRLKTIRDYSIAA